MSTTRELVVHDQTATGRHIGSISLPPPGDRITVRELVRLRVREEVARHNAAPGTTFAGLVQPDGAERVADGYHLDRARRLDWEEQADVAEAAFVRNGFFILVDDRQVTDLDEEISLATDPAVAFVKLTPLVGG